MRICYLSDGISVHDWRFLRSLAKRNHEVHLVSFFPEALPSSLKENAPVRAAVEIKEEFGIPSARYESFIEGNMHDRS
jgi:hypothetical protein